MKVNFGEHILLFLCATYLNHMKKFGDFINFGQNLMKEDLQKDDFRTSNFFPCSQCVPQGVPKSTLVLFHMIFP